jgi:hypothetical protein
MESPTRNPANLSSVFVHNKSMSDSSITFTVVCSIVITFSAVIAAITITAIQESATANVNVDCALFRLWSRQQPQKSQKQ